MALNNHKHCLTTNTSFISRSWWKRTHYWPTKLFIAIFQINISRRKDVNSVIMIRHFHLTFIALFVNTIELRGSTIKCSPEKCPKKSKKHNIACDSFQAMKERKKWLFWHVYNLISSGSGRDKNSPKKITNSFLAIIRWRSNSNKISCPHNFWGWR